MKIYKLKMVIIFFILVFLKNNSVANEDKLEIDYIDRPPYFIVEKNNAKLVDGVLYNLTMKIFNSAKIPFEFKNVPTMRSVLQMKENKFKTCVSYAFKNKERAEIFYFSKPYFKDKKTVLIIRKSDNNFDKYNKIDDILNNINLSLLMKIGFSYGQFLDEKVLKYKNIKISEIQSNKRKDVIFTSLDNTLMLNSIAEKKADYMFIGRNEADYLIENNSKFQLFLKIKELKEMPEGESRHFMCSKIVGLETMQKIDDAIDKVIK